MKRMKLEEIKSEIHSEETIALMKDIALDDIIKYLKSNYKIISHVEPGYDLYFVNKDVKS